MHPFDAAASFFSEPRKPQEEELVGAASSPPSRGTRARAGGENAGIRCHQDCRHRPKAYCAHCCPPPGHVKTTSHVPASQCNSERQQTLASASASPATAAVDVNVEPIPKRPRRHVLPSVAAAPTTTSSVDQPIAATTALERFAREVSMDAVFRRVRLGGGGPEPPEVAYYTTVTIAGHMFRGVLYDIGPHSGSSSTATDDASGTDDGGSGEVGSSLSSCLDLALGL